MGFFNCQIRVIHDRTLERTTNGKGQVNDFTLEQLKELDAGKGEKIPTLKEVLDLVRGKGLIIEIKEAGREENICAVIKERGFENIMLVSFSPQAIKNVKEMLPNLKTGLICSKVFENLVRLALGIEANALLPKSEITSRELIKNRTGMVY